MSAFKNYLAQFPGFNDDIWESALDKIQVKYLIADEYLLRTGKVSKHLIFVNKGLLRLFYLHEGKEINSCFCAENTIAASYSSFVTQSTSRYAIQTLESSEVTMLSKTSLDILYQENPFWQQVGRLAAENELVTSECHTTFLNHSSSEEKYRDVIQKTPHLINRVPLKHLASYLHMTPETLSRVRKKISRT